MLFYRTNETKRWEAGFYSIWTHICYKNEPLIVWHRWQSFQTLRNTACNFVKKSQTFNSSKKNMKYITTGWTENQCYWNSAFWEYNTRAEHGTQKKLISLTSHPNSLIIKNNNNNSPIYFVKDISFAWKTYVCSISLATSLVLRG